MNYLLDLADRLDRAVRIGNAEDDPEGTQYIQLSDTLAREIVDNLHKLFHEKRTIKLYIPAFHVKDEVSIPLNMLIDKEIEFHINFKEKSDEESSCLPVGTALSELAEELYDIIERSVSLDYCSWEDFQEDYPIVYGLFEHLDALEKDKRNEDSIEATESEEEETELTYLSDEKMQWIKSIIQEIAESQKS
jgi:hypothetical protein